MKRAVVVFLALIGLAGCTPERRSPDAIREDTAKATAAAARDAKAVAQGVVQGLKQKGPININKASAADLETLPGIDEAAAHKIVTNRPYADSAELVKRRVISRAQYDKIASQVTTR
jgi:competence protein ComEA